MPTSGLAWPEVAAQDGGAATWANLTNAQGSGSATFATWTSTTANATGNLLLSHYWGQNNMLGGSQPAAINSVTLTIKHYVNSTTYISGATVQLVGADSGPLGSPTTLTRSTTSTYSQTLTFDVAPPTWNDLAEIDVAFVITHNNSTNSGVWYIDSCSMTIDYTPMPAAYKASAIKELGDAEPDQKIWWAYPTWPDSDGTELNFPNVTSGTWQYMVSLQAVDGTNSTLTAKLTKVGTTPDFWWGYTSATFPYPTSGGGDIWPRAVYFRISGNGNLDMIVCDNWANPDYGTGSVVYNASTHAYMRIRHDGTNVYWETATAASGGTAWTTRATAAANTIPDLSYVYIFFRNNDSAVSNINKISCINVLPGRCSGSTATVLVGGDGAWIDPSCAADVSNGAVASWTVPNV